MDLPKLADIDFVGKSVFVRLDLDVPLSEENKIIDTNRIDLALPTLKYILGKNPSRVYLGGHVGRPTAGGVTSTIIFQQYFTQTLGEPVTYRPLVGEPLHDENIDLGDETEHRVVLYENMRAKSGEEADSETFAGLYADGVDFYINEAFAVSHRKNASVDALPRLSKFKSKKAVGFRFAEEVAELSKVLQDPKRPVLVLLSGSKADKLDYLADFVNIADKIVVGGRLPLLINATQRKSEKIWVATLTEDTKDINDSSIEQYKQLISSAGTIVVSGPMGLFDDGVHDKGTKIVLTEVATSNAAFKVAGGGDTEAAIQSLSLPAGEAGLSSKFDWISVGGGAMLEFLAKGTLPGIEALVD